MNKSLGVELLAYSVLLAGLSYLAHRLSPELARFILWGGLMGGALCLIWGGRAVRGCRGRALPILTLIPVSFLMLSQAVLLWGGGEIEVESRRRVALLSTLLCACSIGMLMRIAYAGMVWGPAPGGPPSTALKPR